MLKTNVEGEFYGDGGFSDGGGGFRLRHAYGVWKGVLAGQAWSNFGNTISLFPTVDFNGPLAKGRLRCGIPPESFRSPQKVPSRADR